MRVPIKLVLIAIITFLGGLVVWGVWHFNESAQGEVFDNWEGTNGTFRLRITAFKEKAAFTPGAYYVIHSTSAGSDHWTTIKTIRTDEPHPIPVRQVRFVNDQVAYLFLSSYYIGTKNGGQKWFVWDGDKNISDHQRLNLSPAPKEIELNPDGTGRMVLYPFFKEREKGPDLYTTDYGEHWRIGQ